MSEPRQDHRPMAGGTDETVVSTTMEATPAIPPRTAVTGASSQTRPAQPDVASPSGTEPDAEGMSLARRLRQPR
ncbi:MAG TPA: hypothetical protein VFP66_09805, partial [Candidatus Limnocylindrales bacterium]|nr:hypothetical protein [Candidatus Limnocylindrales bacterium]